MLPLLRLLAPYVVWLYPIGVAILLFYLRAWLVANRDLRASLFTLERESAVARMRRAATGAFTVFALMAGLFAVQFFVVPSIDWAALIRPTPTPDLPISRVHYAPTPTAGTLAPSELTPAPTNTRRPTPRPITLAPSATPTAAISVPPANCPTQGVQIVQPATGTHVQGRVDVRGTARIANFQFYKIELGVGAQPTSWATISDMQRNPVTNGLLYVWDTTGLPAGTYSLRLVVVDVTGNFPPPCEIRLVVGR